MKKRLSIVCLISMIFVLVAGFSNTQDKVYDDADLMSHSEINQLQSLLVETAQAIKCDLIIVTTNDNDGKSSMKYAEDFFMDHSFGYDTKHGDAVLMLINMDDREIWISTSGEAKYVMTDGRIAKTADMVADYLSAGDFYGGCKTFVKYVKKYYQSNSNVDNDYYSSDVNYVINGLEAEDVLIRLLISLVITAIVILILRGNSKAKMTVDSHTYSKNERCNVVNRSDVFIRTTVTKVPKSQNNGGGGGHSSIHRGSGGHSFGGGGRRF